jgi:hypothetical protein
MLTGPGVVRIEWLPGTDVLLGTCHCSAQHEAGDPVAMWEWLLAHPEGHAPGPGADGDGDRVPPSLATASA